MIEATAKKAKTRLTRPAGRAPSGSRSKSSSTTVPEDDGFFSMDEESNDGSQVHSEKDMSPSAPPPEPWEDLTPSAPRMEVQAGYPDVSASSSGAPELDQERGSSPGNHAMIFELVERGKLKHRECINAFKAVDRAHFVPMVTSDSAYAESPLRCGQLHLSAPHIYAQALMALMPLRQGMSFLNIGSGSGYFSCVVSELTGRHARNHGIEIWPENTEHATSCAAAIGKHHLEFTTQNIYELDFTDTQRYDRIYIGACATSKFRFLYRLLEVGGILVGPFQVGEGQELRRVLRQTETEFSVEMLGSVKFVCLVEPNTPPARGGSEPVVNDLRCPAEHGLNSIHATQVYECDVCEMDIPSGTELKYCERCDFAMCETCSVAMADSMNEITQARGGSEPVVNAADVETAFCSNLFEAAQKGDEALVRHFLRMDPMSLRNVGCQRRTALHEAVRNGHKQVVLRILEESAATSILETVDCIGWTPLHYAASKGDEQVVLMLLGKNASPKARDGFRQSAYDIAKRKGHVHLLNQLQTAPENAPQNREEQQRSHGSLPRQEWKCQLCSKKNAEDKEACVTCGRQKGHIPRPWP